MTVRIAAPARQRFVPAFMVQKLDGVIEREVIKFDTKGKKRVELVKEPAGYLVKFPSKGHSIRVRSDAELKRLGFDQTIPLVDDGSDNDDVVGSIPNSIAV